MNALALIIGNANYATDKDKLINAVNDADDISLKLLSLGFIVNKVVNCTGEDFDRTVRTFGNDLKKFDVGLFYFSGHGLQIDGKNYLTSIDTSFADSISAKHTSYPLDAVIDFMQNANPIIKILILDACRDNPLPNQYRSVKDDGLAPIHAPKGTIIAFSTSPGEKALDFGSGRNSIYTGSLLNHIDDTNIPIEDFFKRVRTSVFTLSNGRQTSWEHTSLIGSFYFNSGQLIHSFELPYRTDFIADENFQSSGSFADEIIVALRSHNFYTQKPALSKVSSLPISEMDENFHFILGRNILQTAEGGEFTANSIIKNLDTWLLKFFIGSQNHVLNGILFEIYFDSKGQFRQSKFKNSYLDDIFKLHQNEKFKNSFEFILKQLKPFQEYLFYIPIIPPVALAIEVKFELVKISMGSEKLNVYNLISIKHEEIELLKPRVDSDFDFSVSFDQFHETLLKELCVPKSMLRLSTNINLEDVTQVQIPYDLKLIHKNFQKLS